MKPVSETSLLEFQSRASLLVATVQVYFEVKERHLADRKRPEKGIVKFNLTLQLSFSVPLVRFLQSGALDAFAEYFLGEVRLVRAERKVALVTRCFVFTLSSVAKSLRQVVWFKIPPSTRFLILRLIT
jgi:hypothetical protein